MLKKIMISFIVLFSMGKIDASSTPPVTPTGQGIPFPTECPNIKRDHAAAKGIVLAAPATLLEQVRSVLSVRCLEDHGYDGKSNKRPE